MTEIFFQKKHLSKFSKSLNLLSISFNLCVGETIETLKRYNLFYFPRELFYSRS